MELWVCEDFKSCNVVLVQTDVMQYSNKAAAGLSQNGSQHCVWHCRLSGTELNRGVTVWKESLIFPDTEYLKLILLSFLSLSLQPDLSTDPSWMNFSESVDHHFKKEQNRQCTYKRNIEARS
jgi:hypothetical protein